MTDFHSCNTCTIKSLIFFTLTYFMLPSHSQAYENNSASYTQIKSHCDSVVYVGGKFLSYSAYWGCFKQRGATFDTSDKSWIDGVRQLCGMAADTRGQFNSFLSMLNKASSLCDKQRFVDPPYQHCFLENQKNNSPPDYINPDDYAPLKVYKKCLTKRRVNYDASTWKTLVKNHCENSWYITSKYANYNPYFNCYTERNLTYPHNKDWINGVKQHCGNNEKCKADRNLFASNGYKEIRDKRSGKCLDFVGKVPGNGKKAVLWQCTNVAWQKWSYDGATGLLRNKANPNYCLDNINQRRNGGGVHMWECNARNINQQWDFIRSSIRPRVNHKIALDAFGTKNGSKVGQWSYHGKANQRWYFSDPNPPVMGNPIAHQSSGRCIHPFRGSTHPGNNTDLVLHSHGCKPKIHDKVKFKLTKAGYIRHSASGKCVHPKGGSARPGNNTYLVVHSGCSGDRLKFRRLNNGSIQHVTSGKCIHPKGGSSKPGNNTPIVLHDGCFGGRIAFQTSKPKNKVRVNNAYKEIREKRSGKCLDFVGRVPGNGKGAVLWQCTGVAWQKWNYDKKTGLLRNKANPNFCLDNKNQRRNGGGIHMWKCNARNINQQWDFVGGSIRPRVNHRIAMYAYGTSNGSKIGQWAYHGGKNQLWSQGAPKRKINRLRHKPNLRKQH